jgi:hypothetical protein
MPVTVVNPAGGMWPAKTAGAGAPFRQSAGQVRIQVQLRQPSGSIMKVMVVSLQGPYLNGDDQKAPGSLPAIGVVSASLSAFYQ